MAADRLVKGILVLGLAIPLVLGGAVAYVHGQHWYVVATGDKVEATFTGCTTTVGYRTSSERCGVTYRYDGRVYVATLQDGGTLPGLGRTVGERLDAWVAPARPDEPIRGAILLPAVLLLLCFGLPLFGLLMVRRARRRYAAAHPAAADPS